MDSALSKKKILTNPVKGDFFLAVTYYENSRYFITGPDDFNIGLVCCARWVLIGIV